MVEFINYRCSVCDLDAIDSLIADVLNELDHRAQSAPVSHDKLVFSVKQFRRNLIRPVRHDSVISHLQAFAARHDDIRKTIVSPVVINFFQ